MNGCAHRVLSLLTGLVLATTMWMVPSELLAQDLPESRVFLAPLHGLDLGKPRVISPGRGYNNQPHFSPDGKTLYFTAERPGGQTDILAYSIDRDTLTPVHASAESEYSPTPIPGQLGLSVVRVEADGRQRLWRIDLEDGTTDLLLPQVEPVGYHAWYGPSELALFLLGDVFSLHRARAGDTPSTQVLSGIGRTVKPGLRAGHAVVVDKNQRPWAIASVDMQGGAVEPLLPLFPAVEDFEAGPDGVFWQGLGSKLYHSTPARQWRLAADLSEYGIKTITRIAVAPDGRWISVVSNP